MGSNETATATTGGPRVIDVFDGNGAPLGPNYLLFSDVDRLADSSWIGPGSGNRLRRMRPCLELPRELWIENFGGSWPIEIQRKGPWEMYITLESGGVGGVGDYPCLVPTLGNLGETSGPRIDRIPPTRPPWWRRQYRELNFFLFRPPISVPSVSLDHLRTERHSDSCICLFFSLSFPWQGSH